MSLLERPLHMATLVSAVSTASVPECGSTRYAMRSLREPLRKIQTFAGLVQEEASEKLNDDTLLFLERTSAAAVHMDGLLYDMLVFSRVATHTAPATPVRLDEVVADVLKDYELTIQDLGATVEVARSFRTGATLNYF